MAESGKACDLTRFILQPVGKNLKVEDLEVALSAGLEHIDVSLCYKTPGLGDLLRKYEGKVKILASFRRVDEKESHTKDDNVLPDSIQEQCDMILNALNMQKIDIFYQSGKDCLASVVSMMQELKSLILEDKVAHLGLAQCDPAVIREAHDIHPLSVVTVNRSPWNAAISSPLEDTCKELGIGILALQPCAKGLMKLKYSDPQTVKNEVEHSMKKLQDQLLERARDIYATTSLHIVKRSKNISSRHAARLLKIITRVVAKQDSKFIEKLQAEEGECKPGFVKKVSTIVKHQNDRLINAMGNAIEKHLSALIEKLDGLTSRPNIKVMGVVERQCAALTEKIVRKAYNMRSKHRENLLIKLTARLGDKSSMVAVANNMFPRQNKMIMNRLQNIQKKQAGHLAKQISTLQKRKRDQGVACMRKVVRKHNEVVQKEVQSILGQGKEPFSSLVATIQKQEKKLESKMVRAAQFPSQRAINICKQASKHHQELIADKVFGGVDNHLKARGETAFSVLGESFLKENGLDPSGTLKGVGQSVLEEGVLLNQHFRAIATRKGCSVPVVALAWAKRQGDDIQTVMRIRQPRDIQKVLKSSRLVLDDEDIRELEEATSKFQSQVSSLLSWIDVGDCAEDTLPTT